MKHYTDKEVFCEVASFIIIFVLVTIFVILLETDIIPDEYNNGICLECGGNYEFLTIIGHQHSNDYIYKCDKCGNIIEEPSYHKPSKMEINE